MQVQDPLRDAWPVPVSDNREGKGETGRNITPACNIGEAVGIGGG